MNSLKPIKSALVSVFHKEKLDAVVTKLNELGIDIFSTGGTKDFIEKQGVPVTAVEELTGYPSILGGRVKTLHPKVFGGILARRENQGDLAQLGEYQIPEFDLVIVDLYPFEETVKSTNDASQIIEKIDIGGISLIRAAAKNFKDVLIVSSRNQYEGLLNLLEEKGGKTETEDRRAFAAEAFNVSSHYDTAIFNWFNNGEKPIFKQSIQEAKTLRYGENPHQDGKFFGDLNAVFEQINGKEISYNNLLDIDGAVNLIAAFEETTFAILKHNNACGLASRPTLVDAYKAALAGDPVSAFGGILVSNRTVDLATAAEVSKLFCEVLIAPAYAPDALEVLLKKKNLIILIQKEKLNVKQQFRSLLNGVLLQDKDKKTEAATDLKPVTKEQPNDAAVEDLIFANKIVKHTKSNAIVLAKNKTLCGSGVGQTSRVDALKQAITQAQSFDFDLNGAVLASDAFFPFADSVELANKAGVKYVIQPGGSKRDQDSIDYCNENGVAMVFTGTRHFKH